MAVLFLGTQFQSLKSDGTVNAHGTVEFFEPGTSKPKTTYKDSALSVANSNIIGLSAAGTADIWYSGDADVTVREAPSVVGLADGTIIDTLPNINPSSTGTDATGNYNYVLNPSFEDAADANGKPESWDLFTYSGATATKDTSDPNHGDAAFKLTTANPSTGGGYITSTSAFYVSEDEDLYIEFSIKASAVTITNKFQILWYDKDDAAISTSTIYSEGAASPTSWTRLYATATPPATAVKAKVRVVLADPATSTVGSAQCDGILVRPKEPFFSATASGTDTYTATLAPAIVAYEQDILYKIYFTNASTTTVPTLNLNGLGAKTIKKENAATLKAGEVHGQHLLCYDGTYFIVLNPKNLAASLVPTNDIAGLELSIGTDTDHDIDISKGFVSDTTAATELSLSATWTKQIDATFAAGSDAGGMATTVTETGTFTSSGTAVTGSGSLFDTEFAVGDILYSSGNVEGRRITVIGSATSITLETAFTVDVTVAENVQKNGLAPSTDYYIHLIENDSTSAIDAFYDVSVTAANIPSGYTKYAPLGFITTDSTSNISNTTLVHYTYIPKGRADGWVRISQADLSATSQVDFTLDNGSFDSYMVKLIDLDPFTTGNIGVRVSQNSGSSFFSGAGDYSYSGVYLDNTGTWTANASVADTEIEVSDSNGVNISGDIFFDRPSADYSAIRWNISVQTTTTTQYLYIGQGKYDAATGGFNAIRIFPTTGNLTSGRIELYGIPKLP